MFEDLLAEIPPAAASTVSASCFIDGTEAAEELDKVEQRLQKGDVAKEKNLLQAAIHQKRLKQQEIIKAKLEAEKLHGEVQLNKKQNQGVDSLEVLRRVLDSHSSACRTRRRSNSGG